MQNKIRLIYSTVFIFFFAVIMSAQTNNYNEQLKLARAFEQSGEYKKAGDIYKELLEAQPDNNLFFEGLNRTYIQTKNYEASIKLLENKIKLHPEDIVTYGMLGVTYHMMDNISKAFEIWNKGIEHNPASPSSYRIIANYMIERRAIDDAITTLMRGRERLKQPGLFAFDLATLYSSMMKYKEAAQEYCYILAVQPNQLNGIIARLKNYIFRSDALPITTDYVKEFVNDNPSPQLYLLMGFLYQSSDDYTNAFEYIKRGDELIRKDGKEIRDFAADALSKNKFESAAQAYEYIINNYPSSPFYAEAKIGYAYTYEMKLRIGESNKEASWKPITAKHIENLNDYKKVIDLYSGILSDTNNGNLKSEANFRIATILENVFQESAKADSILNFITRQFPASEYTAPAFLERGKIAVKLGNLNEAESYFNIANQSSQNSSEINNEAKYLRAKTAFWQCDFQKTGTLLAEATVDLKSTSANDAIELAMLVNIAQNDSAGLAMLANADLLIQQNKLNDAAENFKNLSNSDQSSILGEYAKFTYAKVLLALNELPTAIVLLEEIADSSASKIYSDKALFLLGETYQFGINDKLKAISMYEKLLASFPNSLYLDKARENIIFLNQNFR